MNILQNAVDSIVLGIEDFNSTDPRRIISATRNLVAGILLLVKHKLATLSPPGSDDVLIKQRVLPTISDQGPLEWVGEGKKTVDVQQMKDRCTSLGIKVDWSRLEKIVGHRNDIEHYFSLAPQAAIRTLMADSFVVIRDFVRNELNEDPRELLGAPTWTALTNVAEVYEKEKAECAVSLESVNWTFAVLLEALKEWECPECGSGLIEIANPGAKWSAQLKCRSCGHEIDSETAAESAVKDHFAGENHYAAKDGGDPVTVDCPVCNRDAYHLGENCCLICEESVERECQRCGCPIPASELDDSGYCGWCNHMMAKDD